MAAYVPLRAALVEYLKAEENIHWAGNDEEQRALEEKKAAEKWDLFEKLLRSSP